MIERRAAGIYETIHSIRSKSNTFSLIQIYKAETVYVAPSHGPNFSHLYTESQRRICSELHEKWNESFKKIISTQNFRIMVMSIKALTKI